MAPPPPPLPPATKPPPSQPFSPSTTATESASRHQPQHHRPAFTAFQQHYTPAKSLAPKPLTATFLAAPTPSKLPANIAASAETSRLQTELLQLHLLHRAGPAASAAWRVSAAGRLRARFDDLAAREAEVALRERGAVEAHNALALRDWGGLEEKLPVLDAVVSAVWSLGEPGGRFARLVRRFEKWAERVADAVAARSDSGARGGQEVVFVSELDAGWRDECEGLSRRLDECRRMLQGLDDGRDRDEAGAGAVGDPSSLEVVLGACRTLVHDMLAELEIMERMQREAVAQEDMWVRGRNRAWAVRDQDTETPRAGAIWRAFSGAGPGGQDARCAWS
ncbi:hypothetical protein P8C59_008549 [Phyllachora maydis]|nr:hypothetical protein P8C59_008549 [Phyllachora maydis]